MLCCSVPFRPTFQAYPCVFEERGRIINNPSARLAAGGTKLYSIPREGFGHSGTCSTIDRTESKNSKQRKKVEGLYERDLLSEPKAVCYLSKSSPALWAIRSDGCHYSSTMGGGKEGVQSRKKPRLADLSLTLMEVACDVLSRLK